MLPDYCGSDFRDKPRDFGIFWFAGGDVPPQRCRSFPAVIRRKKQKKESMPGFSPVELMDGLEPPTF